MPESPRNLYLHFPFCRGKCSYCALHSRGGASNADRTAYSRQMAAALAALAARDCARGSFRTVYLGGGTPAICDLEPVLAALGPMLAPDAEVTVELHPLDVSDDLLSLLADRGVNRISMGVQSLDDATLADMRRGYAAADAACAFSVVRRHFENAGIDLIVGYPGDPGDWLERLKDWGLAHCSAYTLQLEEGTILRHRIEAGKCPPPPSDDATLDRFRETAEFLSSVGLKRYEISNFAVPGYECRHNLAVWSGEDYLGLGEGAHGRVGRLRTMNAWSLKPERGGETEVEEVSAAADRTERLVFRLRTREGIDARMRPEWTPTLEHFAAEGLLSQEGEIFRLTRRGAEVCDSILAELV